MADEEHQYRNEWELFFNSHAPYYLQNPFTENTISEVDFLLSLFSLPKGAKILDVGCGPGRHAIELASRGYQVTAIDFSQKMLEEGGRLAAEREVEVDFVLADATEFVTSKPHDMAICLCEGAFNIVGHSEDPLTHDIAILKNVAKSLKPDAPFVLNALNGYRTIRNLTDEAIASKSFDPLTMISVGEHVWHLPEGTTKLNIRERLYTPPEVAAMLHHTGFKVLALYGGTAGEWGKRPLRLDEIEALFVCTKRI